MELLTVYSDAIKSDRLGYVKGYSSNGIGTAQAHGLSIPHRTGQRIHAEDKEKPPARLPRVFESFAVSLRTGLRVSCDESDERTRHTGRCRGRAERCQA